VPGCAPGPPPRRQVQKKTVEACRSYLELPHFNRDVIYTKSHAAAGLCEWAVNIVRYYDVVSEVGGGGRAGRRQGQGSLRSGPAGGGRGGVDLAAAACGPGPP
jgi:hypothetical protein